MNETSTNKAQFLATILREGETYAGIILGKGEPDYHLILLPGEQVNVQWKTALDWAKGIGGDLPTRREQSLLIANAKEEFKQAWYWSSETHQTSDSYAWCQTFSSGRQYYDHKYDSYHARAVRRLVI